MVSFFTCVHLKKISHPSFFLFTFICSKFFVHYLYLSLAAELAVLWLSVGCMGSIATSSDDTWMYTHLKTCQQTHQSVKSDIYCMTGRSRGSVFCLPVSLTFFLNLFFNTLWKTVLHRSIWDNLVAINLNVGSPWIFYYAGFSGLTLKDLEFQLGYYPCK